MKTRKEAKLLVPHRPHPRLVLAALGISIDGNGSVLGGVPGHFMGSKLFAFSCVVSSHVTREIDCSTLIKCFNVCELMH